MGFVLSGMNGGALIAPFLAGIIYDRAGYYAVFGVCLGVVGFDFVLRISMIEKSVARRWLNESPADEGTRTPVRPGLEERESLLPKDSVSRSRSSTHVPNKSHPEARYPDTDALLQLPGHFQEPRPSWFVRTFPAMATLLRSRRILAAVYGCFTHTMLISSFDAVLALFVKRTFQWSSTGAGLVFLAITVPSTLGAAIGALSDRYGTRAVALFGFALTIPSLALLGVVTHGRIEMQAALIILLVANGESLRLIDQEYADFPDQSS